MCEPGGDGPVDSTRLPFAFLISLAATLCTILGAAVVLASRVPKPSFLAFGLAFSAGVMIFLSLFEMLGSSRTAFASTFSCETTGKKWGLALSLCFFIVGIAVTHGLNLLVHKLEDKAGLHTCECPGESEGTFGGGDGEKSKTPNEVADERGCSAEDKAKPQFRSDFRSALMVGCALAIHNLPEGFSIFFATASDLKAGLPLAVALAIHKAPEGLAVALAVFAQTGNRMKAFLYGGLSSLPILIGAGIAWLTLLGNKDAKPSPMMHAVVFAFVGGMMLYVSFTELIPHSYKYDQKKAQLGVITGMILIATSFVVFDLI